jgi:hypothetical protein
VALYPNDHRSAPAPIKGPDGEAVFILPRLGGLSEVRESYGFDRAAGGRIRGTLANVLGPCAKNGAIFMALTGSEFQRAEARMQSLQGPGGAVGARYDRCHRRVAVSLNTGVQGAMETLVSVAPAEPERI